MLGEYWKYLSIFNDLPNEKQNAMFIFFSHINVFIDFHYPWQKHVYVENSYILNAALRL